MTTHTATYKSHHGWRLGLGAVIGLAAVLMVFTNVGASSPASVDVQFGCDDAMVIANTDCALGHADAFSPGQAVADIRSPAVTAIQGAPWCGPEPDVTVYGCAIDRHKVRDTCDQSVPPKAAELAEPAAMQECDFSAWVEAVVVSGSDEPRNSNLCRVLTNPPPACNGTHGSSRSVVTGEALDGK